MNMNYQVIYTITGSPDLPSNIIGSITTTIVSNHNHDIDAINWFNNEVMLFLRQTNTKGAANLFRLDSNRSIEFGTT